MRVILWVSCLALVGCATNRPKENSDCTRRVAFQKGVNDATIGRTREVAKACRAEVRAGLLQSYHEGFESVRSRRLGQGRGPTGRIRVVSSLPSALNNPTWVCEVEAAEKIFTGVGTSQEEASTAAHSTCSSHLQASYCRKTECKENL
ncbi:MAG: hypothetical protein AB7K68_10130 [Bacteriovoracia bacterium]